MSTRCQLRFVRSLPDGRTADPDAPVAQVYKHSDGYPAPVVQSLTELRALLSSTGTIRGPSYAAAQFLWLDSLGTLRLYLAPDRAPDRRVAADDPVDACHPDAMKHLDQPLFLLGHGVEDPRHGIHGDEEYLYLVEVPAYEVEMEDPPTWRVAVSAHCGFPRWDEPTDAAFERADWRFEGSLHSAQETFDGGGPQP